jgi:LDH2 family malate/lactate/ureidoglycolate dehydrogenase
MPFQNLPVFTVPAHAGGKAQLDLSTSAQSIGKPIQHKTTGANVSTRR